jgi:hypothetical protein
MHETARPIEIYLYEPDQENPGFARYAGNRPVGDVFKELKQRLEAEGLLPEEYFCLEYPEPLKPNAGVPFPEFRRLACYAVTGANEGYYVHVDAWSPAVTWTRRFCRRSRCSWVKPSRVWTSPAGQLRRAPGTWERSNVRAESGPQNHFQKGGNGAGRKWPAPESMKALANCRNLFGKPIHPEAKKRIIRFLADPTVENWDDIYGIIISPKGTTVTIWNAVLALDPTFPRTGRVTDLKGNVIEEWERVPTPLQVLQAIKLITG